MKSHTEWMLSFIPTLIGTIILAVSLFSAAAPLLSGYLKLISISSMVQNLLKNSFEALKFLVGVGG